VQNTFTLHPHQHQTQHAGKIKFTHKKSSHRTRVDDQLRNKKYAEKCSKRRLKQSTKQSTQYNSVSKQKYRQRKRINCIDEEWNRIVEFSNKQSKLAILTEQSCRLMAAKGLLITK